MIPDSRIRHGAASAAVLLLLVAACEAAAPEVTTGMGETVYADVVSDLADLQRFPPPGADSTARRARADSVRQSILDQYGVTAEELLGFAERVGLDPKRMESISVRIVARTDSLARARAATTADTTAAAAVADSIPWADSVLGADSVLEADSVLAADSIRGADSTPAADAVRRRMPISIRGRNGELVNPRRLSVEEPPPRG
jgi:hypothetical protein